MPRAGGLVMAALFVACTGSGETDTTLGPGGSTDPVTAVSELHSSLNAGDFGAAGSLSVPGQAALASLAEGAPASVVAAALRDGDDEVAANFWSGFAQGVGESMSGEMQVEEVGTASQQGVDFFLVEVSPEQGGEQVMVTRDVEGQHVDLFASFGAALAEDMFSPVELLIGSSDRDSVLIMDALQEVVPSLLVAADDERLSSEAEQSILRLVELITRVG